MTTTTIGKKAARGTIVELLMHDGRESVRLRDYDPSEVRDGILTIDFVKGQSRPAIRANEVATLLRDSALAVKLNACTNMDQRKQVLIPLAQQGYRVDDPLNEPSTPQGSPEPEPVTTPEPEPVVPHADVEALKEQVAALAEQVKTLAPTIIQVGGREPITLPAGELIHEATPEIIEDIADGMHVYMTGEPGTGKSRLAYTVAKALGFTPEDVHIFPVSNMDQKNSLLGFISPVTSEFVPGPLYWGMKGKFVMLEELDAGNGAAMTATNVVLDAPAVTFPNGETIERPEQVFIIGAGNTTGKGGDMMFLRNQMDAATRNRWVFHHVTYDRNIERGVVTPILGERANAWLAHCWSIREALSSERIVFSTRNIRHGALMLARGRDIATIVERALLPGESADIVRKSGALNWAA